MFCAVCVTAPHSPPSGSGAGAELPELGGGVTGMPMSPSPAAPVPAADAPLAPVVPPAPAWPRRVPSPLRSASAEQPSAEQAAINELRCTHFRIRHPVPTDFD